MCLSICPSGNLYYRGNTSSLDLQGLIRLDKAGEVESSRISTQNCFILPHDQGLQL
jgi:hypothetical protein